MEYKDMTDRTVLTVQYIPSFKATRLLVNNMNTRDSSAIDLDNDSLLILVIQLNGLIENEKKDF